MAIVDGTRKTHATAFYDARSQIGNFTRFPLHNRENPGIPHRPKIPVQAAKVIEFSG